MDESLKNNTDNVEEKAEDDFTTSNSIKEVLKDLPEVLAFIQRLQECILRQQLVSEKHHSIVQKSRQTMILSVLFMISPSRDDHPMKVRDGLIWCKVAGEGETLRSSPKRNRYPSQDRYLSEVKNPDSCSAKRIREPLRRVLVLILLTEKPYVRFTLRGKAKWSAIYYGC
ncbi:hypothetical protein J6590_002807 [Homalodisca vitripennis]|nr:hypothetical protein J6590_002807 [Homalodisca vitripennis]